MQKKKNNGKVIIEKLHKSKVCENEMYHYSLAFCSKSRMEILYLGREFKDIIKDKIKGKIKGISKNKNHTNFDDVFEHKRLHTFEERKRE